MKLLIVTPRNHRLGGAEQTLGRLMSEVATTGITPVVCFLEHGPFEREIQAHGVTTHSFDAGRLRQAGRFAKTVGWLSNVMREEDPDVILDWMQKSHLYGAPAAVLARMTDRLVWMQHDIPGLEWLNVVSTLLPARAVGTSSNAVAAAQRRLRPRRRTFVVPHGIIPPPSSPAEETAALRESLAIPPGRFVVGILARLQPWKGQHHVLRATALLRQRGHDVHCVVVGGDAGALAPEYEPALRRLADELEIRDYVTFTGQVPDGPRYIQVMDVALNASDAEPHGLSILEAMALGVPVVAVDAGGPAEILAGERGGLLVPSPEPVELADAVERLITDSALRSRLAAGGRAAVETDYSVARTLEGLERTFEALVHDSGRAPA